MTKLFWRSYLKIIGWETQVVFPYDHLKKYVLIVGPHTSNWDFIIGLAYRSLLNLGHVNFLGKQELFVPPFGFLFRSIGGIPVDRRSSHHLVDDVAKMFLENEAFCIALSPEGTRKKVDKLRTGFYFIASKAKVPIVMVAFDYQNKRVHFAKPLLPSDQFIDFKTIVNFYKTVSGKNPAQGLMEYDHQ
jgi:1-acyl-sn-glycerol-3-phosphate acyltransferase